MSTLFLLLNLSNLFGKVVVFENSIILVSVTAHKGQKLNVFIAIKNSQTKFLLILFKYKAVDVVSSCSLLEQFHVRFTTALFKALSDQKYKRYSWFLFKKLFIFNNGFSITET